MWHNNKTVSLTHSKKGSQQAWAYFSGMSGWKRIRTGAADGVSNIYFTLCQAKANGRKVDVYLNGNNVEQVTLK